MNLNNGKVILKLCPKCKTPILKTQRFMNHVKVILKDISIIKRKQLLEQASIQYNKNEILNSLKVLNNSFDYLKSITNKSQFNYLKDLWTSFSKPLLDLYGKTKFKLLLPSKDIESLDFVIKLFKSTSKLKLQIQDIKDDEIKELVCNHFVWLLSVVFTYAQQLSIQQKIDINMEVARGVRIINLYKIMTNTVHKMSISVQSSETIEVNDLVYNMKNLLMSHNRYSVVIDEEINSLGELIKQKIMDSTIITTKDQQKIINEAMLLSFMRGTKSQGHWCKCINNHIYCVLECEGPMQKDTCPECEVEIRGSRHRYVDKTIVASDIDEDLDLFL